MKLLILSHLILCQLLQFGFAQKYTLGVNTSYSFSVPNTFSGINEVDIDPLEMSHSAIRGSLAAGLGLGLEGKVKIHENAFFGLEFSKFYGNEVLFHNYNRNGIYENIKGFNQQLRLKPSVLIQLVLKKITFEMQSTLIIPLQSKTQISSEEIVEALNYSTKRNDNYLYNFSIGFAQNIGLKVDLSRKISLRSSLGITLLNQSLKSKNTNSYIVNDQETADQMTTYAKSINYTPKLSNYSNNETYNVNYDTQKSKEELIYSHNFSSIYVSISVVYNFGGKN